MYYIDWTPLVILSGSSDEIKSLNVWSDATYTANSCWFYSHMRQLFFRIIGLSSVNGGDLNAVFSSWIRFVAWVRCHKNLLLYSTHSIAIFRQASREHGSIKPCKLRRTDRLFSRCDVQAPSFKCALVHADRHFVGHFTDCTTW